MFYDGQGHPKKVSFLKGRLPDELLKDLPSNRN